MVHLFALDFSHWDIIIVWVLFAIINFGIFLYVITLLPGRIESDKRHALSILILKTLNRNIELKVMMDSIIRDIKQEMGFSAVGLRLNAENDFPYYSHAGFSPAFLQAENAIPYTCGQTISGNINPADPHFTMDRSFWTNNSLKLLESAPDGDLRLHQRNNCIHYGYSSYAIIPIRTDNAIIGTLQINVKEKNAFTVETISFFEGIALNIGTGILRKQAEELVNKTNTAKLTSESFYRSLFENHSAIKLLIDPENGNLFDANLAALEFYRWPYEEMKLMNISDLNVKNNISRVLSVSPNNSSFHLQRQHKKSDCTIKDVEIFGHATVLGERKLIHAIIIDITDRLKAEELLKETESKIRNFATHLNSVLENERSFIAREIHDELGQRLSVLKIELSAIRNMNSPDKPLFRTLNDLILTVDDNMQMIRKIATRLRPSILDTLGLGASIRWLADEFEKHTHVNCNVNSTIDERMFPKDISTCYFRICQESLNNISKHSKASIVKIDIKCIKNELILQISDNGIGIISNKLNNPFSMGLLGMRERAAIIGGELIIESYDTKGTIVQLKLKLN
jgi:PAS domain S-box-containing protein